MADILTVCVNEATGERRTFINFCPSGWKPFFGVVVNGQVTNQSVFPWWIWLIVLAAALLASER